MDNNEYRQTLSLENRKKLIVDSVLNIGILNEDYLEISTKLGYLCIEGRDLKVEELRKEEGKIIVCGIVSGIFYKDNKTSKGFLSGILK